MSTASDTDNHITEETDIIGYVPVEKVGSSLQDVQRDFYRTIAWQRYRDYLNDMLPPSNPSLLSQYHSLCGEFHSRVASFDDLFSIRPEPGRGFGLYCERDYTFNSAETIIGFYTGPVLYNRDYMQYPDDLREKWDDYAVTVYAKKYLDKEKQMPAGERVIVIGQCIWQFANDASIATDPAQRAADMEANPPELTFTFYSVEGRSDEIILLPAIASTSRHLKKGFVHLDYGSQYWAGKRARKLRGPPPRPLSGVGPSPHNPLATNAGPSGPETSPAAAAPSSPDPSTPPPASVNTTAAAAAAAAELRAGGLETARAQRSKGVASPTHQPATASTAATAVPPSDE